MSSDRLNKRPPVADRLARGSQREPSREQHWAARWRTIEGLTPSERLMETLRALEAAAGDGPSGNLSLEDGLLVYTGPVGEIPEDFLEAAREERLRELMR